jgi:DNA-binding NtrC family response regulator
MSDRILFVDDDPNLLAAFQRNLRKKFSFDTALGAEKAPRLLQASEPYAVVLTDMNMPGMNGIELLERIATLSPATVRLMLTGSADQQTATVDAVDRGRAFSFLNKPCPSETLVSALENGLKHFQLLRLEREQLEGTLAGSVKMLTDALGRGQRLRESMNTFARHLGVGPAWEL